MLIRRILMNAQDTSPGTGAPSTAPVTAPVAPAASAVTPAAAPAPQPAPAPQGAAVDVAAITKSISDGVFASLRRAGVLPNKPTTQVVPVTDGTTTTAAPGINPISALDVQGMIEQASAITRVSVEYGLQPEAEASLKKLIAVEKPDDPLAWGRGFAESMGLKRGATAPATAVTTTTTVTPTAAPAATPAPVPAPAPATAIPVTDRGSPPPPTRPLEERSLYEMSEADRQEFIKRHGPTKFAQKLMSDAKGRRTIAG